MRITIRYARSLILETVSDISSFLLHDPLGSPVLVALEYAMPEGTAWTFASSEERDFYRILETSGVMRTLIPGNRFGTANLLCSPVLRRGVPRWFTDVDALVASTEAGIPLFLAHQIAPERFGYVYQHEPQFRERLSELWNQRR